jgi:ABC-type transporter Mla MlaB component
MEIYQHDHAAMFRFVLRGELDARSLCELEHAWETATSVTKDKAVVVDVTGLTTADPAGMELLARMRRSGARFTAAVRTGREELFRLLEVAASSPDERSSARSAPWGQKLRGLVRGRVTS